MRTKSTVTCAGAHGIPACYTRKAEERLETLLLEGLGSAETELTSADWKAIRKEALAKLEARKKTN